MLEGKTIKSVEMDNQGTIVLTTDDGTEAKFGSDTVRGDSMMTCATLHVDGKAVFPRGVALEPAGA